MKNRWLGLAGLVWVASVGCKRGPDAETVQRCTSARTEATLARLGVNTSLLLNSEAITERSTKFRHWQHVEPTGDAGADAGAPEQQDFHRFLLAAAQESRAMQAYTEALEGLGAATRSRPDAGADAPSMIAATDAVTTTLGALRTQAEAANRAAAPVLANSYQRQESVYNRLLEGLARHPENGSPLMDQLSLFESLAETSAILDADTENLVTTNCGLDWSHQPALRPARDGLHRPYRPFGTPSSVTITEAQIRERLTEIQRRRAEVAAATQRPAAELLPETELAPQIPRLRASVEGRERACRGIP